MFSMLRLCAFGVAAGIAITGVVIGIFLVGVSVGAKF